MGIIFMVNADMPMMYKRFMQEEQNSKKRKKKQKENNSESFQEILDKAMQRALLQYFNPKNRELVIRALKKAGREDLIGFSDKCLVKPLNGNDSRNFQGGKKKNGKKSLKKR